jgi:hypothetical protein
MIKLSTHLTSLRVLFGDLTAKMVNDARYNLFTQGKFGEDCLPPSKDALALHVDGDRSS